MAYVRVRGDTANGACWVLKVADGGFSWLRLAALCSEGDRGVRILLGALSPRELEKFIDVGVAPALVA